MLAWIFQVAGKKPNFLVGGIAENFGKATAWAAARNSFWKATSTIPPSGIRPRNSFITIPMTSSSLRSNMITPIFIPISTLTNWLSAVW